MLQKLVFLLFFLKTSKSYSLRAGRVSLPIQKAFDKRDEVFASRRKLNVSTMKLSNLNSREGSNDGKVAERLKVESPTLRFQIPQMVAASI